MIQYFTCNVKGSNIVPWHVFKVKNKLMAVIILLRSHFYKIGRRLGEFMLHSGIQLLHSSHVNKS